MHSPRKGSWHHFTQNNAPCPSSFFARLAGTRDVETGVTGPISAGPVYRSTSPEASLAVRVTAVETSYASSKSWDAGAINPAAVSASTFAQSSHRLKASGGTITGI